MKSWSLFLVLTLVSGQLFAQEQMALRLNEKGLLKILRLAIQYNTSSKSSRTVVIPKNIYKFTIPKSQLVSNPIIPIINEISDLNMNRDLDFYLNTSDIQFTGDVDTKSLKATIFNSGPNGFDMKLSMNLPKVSVNAANLSLCEDRNRNSKTCGKGLKATLTNLKITSSSRPIIVTAVLRLRTDGKVARVTVRSVDSNLDNKSSPNLNINFSALTIPKISIVINGQETELDTSRLKSEILNRKTFLSKKLLAFAADFIAGDVAEMINIYLVNKEVATSYQVYRRDRQEIKFEEFVANRDLYSVRDNLYVRPSIYNLPYVIKKDPMATMIEQISDIIRSAQLDISLKKISTPSNKDIELSGMIDFSLNGKKLNVKNTLGNSSRTLPALNLTASRNHDLNLVISEPLINGALDLANSTKLFQELFETMSPVQGFSVKSVKLHFQNSSSLVAVVNAQVDLKKLASKGITSWFKNKFAAWLERNNNNSVIYFPIEVGVTPVFKKLSNGSTGLDLKVLSPFNGSGLHNKFKYPSNVPAMTDTVKEGVMDELKDSLEDFTNKTYSVDLTRFLNQAGVVFTPKAISINQGAYLQLDLDVSDIKFNSKNPTLR